jgi:hypothetical protein
MDLVYIDKDDDKDNDELSDALFWSAYLVDDDSDVAPLVLVERKPETDIEPNAN